jgi:hypothetical protein
MKITMRHRTCAVLVISCMAGSLIGCAASPRQRPIPTTAIAEGAMTADGVRKQLEGRWVLVSLTVTAEDGRRTAVEATGALTSDEFGMHVEYRMSDSGQKSLAALGITSPDPVISTTGRVVIDPRQQQITYVGEDFEKRAQGFDPDLAARRANPFALERTRYYAFGDDGTLTLSTRYDSGKEAAVSHWRRTSG